MTNIIKLTPLEYVSQIHSHRSRVLRIAKNIYGPRSVEAKLMDYHDLEKWILLPLMLYFYYKGNSVKSRYFYDLLNSVGLIIQDIVFWKEKLAAGANEWERLKNVERAIDVLDRSFDPIAIREFGRFPADWRSYLNEKQMEIANMIKDRYDWTKEGIINNEEFGYNFLLEKNDPAQLF